MERSYRFVVQYLDGHAEYLRVVALSAVAACVDLETKVDMGLIASYTLVIGP
ncbi:hypothetical protein [Burkholderia cenocepacia]|uniref:hypothetical protein n=1 Tax=Burkholderia cenocepacia TaxID=95486 RepID=UPI002650B305|nr:hypothetical protein [Burkholderia cenocepacia]MDN7541975.1 hypothetical protein [Burkholderia cenocepacia]